MIFKRKIHHAIKLLLALAKEKEGEFVTLDTLAHQINISRRTAESAITPLRLAGLIIGVKNVGHCFASGVSWREISIGSIIKAIAEAESSKSNKLKPGERHREEKLSLDDYCIAHLTILRLGDMINQ